mmetsp:Transcript_4290/g.13013  ORF Transcript_4290/g.13013 Transcript_4290/m.13013 type:complete len:218 (-) Transcript_4290:4501-5154(-)
MRKRRRRIRSIETGGSATGVKKSGCSSFGSDATQSVASSPQASMIGGSCPSGASIAESSAAAQRASAAASVCTQSPISRSKSSLSGAGFMGESTETSRGSSLVRALSAAAAAAPILAVMSRACEPVGRSSRHASVPMSERTASNAAGHACSMCSRDATAAAVVYRWGAYPLAARPLAAERAHQSRSNPIQQVRKAGNADLSCVASSALAVGSVATAC